MKKPLFIALFALVSFVAKGQVIVNEVDVTQETEMFEVWAFKKPFSNKESYFMNYGQDKFRPHYYDHRTQAIRNSEGERFEKGDWLKLYKYLKEQGYEITGERPANIGDVQGRVMTFEKQQPTGN